MVSELLPTPCTIIIGFAAQRFLMEIVAGTRDEWTLSRYERRVPIG